jgi:hypothetical protein
MHGLTFAFSSPVTGEEKREAIETDRSGSIRDLNTKYLMCMSLNQAAALARQALANTSGARAATGGGLFSTNTG